MLSTAAACTPLTARPEGSAMPANSGHQSSAAGDEQAIDFSPGTVCTQACPGYKRSNRSLYSQASLVAGVLCGKRALAAANSRSATTDSACALRASIQL